MPRYKRHVVAQRPELVADRSQQIGMVAPRKIGAANGACEQYVSDQRHSITRMKEDDVTRGVTGTMQHL